VSFVFKAYDFDLILPLFIRAKARYWRYCLSPHHKWWG